MNATTFGLVFFTDESDALVARFVDFLFEEAERFGRAPFIFVIYHSIAPGATSEPASRKSVAEIPLARGFAMFQRIRETSSIIDMETRLFIAGRYLDAAGSARFPVIEPATERELAQVASASADDVNRAVDAARDAAIADRGRG